MKTGVPTCPGAPAWPAYTRTSDQLMRFANDGASVQAHFDAAAYDLLDHIHEISGMRGGAPSQPR